jgi:hypothetical protein
MANKVADAKGILSVVQRIISDGKPTVDLPRDLGEIHENELWKQWRSSTGIPFESFNDALQANQPHGLGLGQYNGWLSAAHAWALCTGYPKVRKELLKLAAKEVQPIAKNGTIGNGRSFDNIKPTQGGTSAGYLLGRIKREANAGNAKAADALARLENGELTSPRLAAIRCGIVKVADSDKDRCPIQRIKMYWKRANKNQRKEFLAWLKTAESQVD